MSHVLLCANKEIIIIFNTKCEHTVIDNVQLEKPYWASSPFVAGHIDHKHNPLLCNIWQQKLYFYFTNIPQYILNFSTVFPNLLLQNSIAFYKSTQDQLYN